LIAQRTAAENDTRATRAHTTTDAASFAHTRSPSSRRSLLRMSAEQVPLGKRDYYGLLGVTFEVSRSHRAAAPPDALAPRRRAA